MGLASTGLGLFSSNSSTSRKLGRKTTRLADTQSQVAMNRANRAKEDFYEDSQRAKLQLNENLAARGMGFSTHAADQRQAFQNDFDRMENALGEDQTMANQGADLHDYQQKAGKRFRSLEVISNILGMGESAAAVGMGMFGAPGGGAGTGTSGLDAAHWE